MAPSRSKPMACSSRRVTGRTPLSLMSYSTRFSHVDCIRSISNIGIFIRFAPGSGLLALGFGPSLVIRDSLLATRCSRSTASGLLRLLQHPFRDPPQAFETVDVTLKLRDDRARH